MLRALVLVCTHQLARGAGGAGKLTIFGQPMGADAEAAAHKIQHDREEEEEEGDMMEDMEKRHQRMMEYHKKWGDKKQGLLEWLADHLYESPGGKVLDQNSDGALDDTEIPLAILKELEHADGDHGNNNHVLTRKEFMDAGIDAVFNALDHDKDGVLTKTELPPDVLKHIEVMCDLDATNDDGTVTREEFSSPQIYWMKRVPRSELEGDEL